MRAAATACLCVAALVGLLTTAPAPAQDAPAAEDAVLVLRAEGRGEIVATTGAGDPVTCSSECEGTYRPGTRVRMEARPDATEGPSEFVMWSDDRCPATPVCELPVDAEWQAATALFSTQRVAVTVRTGDDPAVVTSDPPGLTCAVPANQTRRCEAEFPLDADVRLTAAGIEPVWRQREPDELGDQCDEVTGATCRVRAIFGRAVRVGFQGKVPTDQLMWAILSGGGRGRLGAVLQIGKAGTGHGTVSSALIDCGALCSTTAAFGTRQVLVARPQAGSRFVRWTGLCGTAPRCPTFLGPVTRLTAVFDAVGGGNPGGGGRDRSTPFKASVGTLLVTRRAIRFVTAVSAPATVRARLQRGARRVAQRSWALGRGFSRLRLGVPRGTRPGMYRLRITARSRSGTTRRFTVPVRVRG